MNNYEITFLPSALVDFDAIFNYVKNEDINAAKNLIDALETEIEKLSSFPQMGSIPKNRRIRKSGYRMLIVENYIVFYLLENNEVIVARIIHAKRKYTSLI